MISVKLSSKWDVCLLFLLTLIFDRMGRLGQIGSIWTPFNILTLGAEIKKLADGTFLKYPLSKQNKQKNIFGGHFPSEHNGVTDYICLFWIYCLFYYCLSKFFVNHIPLGKFGPKSVSSSNWLKWRILMFIFSKTLKLG